jgi:hypothetical protein
MYHYRFEDALRLATHGVPIMRLTKLKGALEVLREHADTGHELKDMLSLYPHVRYEPLDFHYVCQQSLSALNVHLINDLANRCTWAGYVWGAFLTGMAQEERYLSYFDARYDHFHRYQWLVDEVRAAVNAQPDTPLSPFGTLLTRLRDQLKPLPRLPVQLRLEQTAEAVEKRKAAVLDAYRKGDRELALAVART